MCYSCCTFPTGKQQSSWTWAGMAATILGLWCHHSKWASTSRKPGKRKLESQETSAKCLGPHVTSVTFVFISLASTWTHLLSREWGHTILRAAGRTKNLLPFTVSEFVKTLCQASGFPGLHSSPLCPTKPPLLPGRNAGQPLL